jgi:hypothetical protein
MREALQAYVKRVGELAEHVRGNEQATKQSLVGPLFTILGCNLTDPRECIPEYRVDFGPNRSVKPIDWAFLQNGHPIFFVKIHLAERYTWVMCRLYLGRKRPSVWVPLPQEQAQALTPGLMLSTPQDGWTCITLNASGEIDRLGDILRAAWDSQKAIRAKKPETSEEESPSLEGNGVPTELESAITPGEMRTSDDPSNPFGG